MSTEQAVDGGWYVEPLQGEIDLYTAPQLRSTLLARLGDGQVRLILDMSEVSFIDSSGFAVLVSALKRSREAGGDVRIVTTDAAVLSSMRISRLDRLFEVFPDVSAAQLAAPSESAQPW